MAKDSQLDSKSARKAKAKGGQSMANDALDGESKNNKKQNADRGGTTGNGKGS